MDAPYKKVIKPKVTKILVSFFSIEVISIFIPTVLFNVEFMLVAIFFPIILLIGRMLAIIGDKKLTNKAKKKLSEV